VVDQYLTPNGDDWLEAIEQALYECWLMVVVLSEHSAGQPNFKMQYRYFLNRDKAVVPLLLDADVSLPVELAKKRIIVHNPNDKRGSIHRLIFEIKELRKLTQK